MSWVASRQGGTESPSVPPDLDSITDEEFLKQLWQKVEDFGDRRRIRARMYKLREKRLREMVQNDEESLGALTLTEQEGADTNDHSTNLSTTTSSSTHTSEAEFSQRKSSVEVKMSYKNESTSGDMSSRFESSSTMKSIDSNRGKSDDEIIDDRIMEVSKGRAARYQQVLNKYDETGSREGLSVSRTNYSVESNALTGDSYQSMKHKEVRDSVSPVRGAFDRKVVGEESETFFTSDEEVAIKSESESVSSRNTSKDDRASVKSSSKRITERKVSRELDFSNSRYTDKNSPTSPKSQEPSSRVSSKRSQKDSPISSGKSTPTRRTPSGSGSRTPIGKKQKMNEVAKKMDLSIKNEYNKLNKYINENVDEHDEIIKEEEEEMEDESGNTVKMIIQTRRKKDGTEIISRRLARSTKIVDKESDIDEILVGNPDHEVLERNVEEKEEKDGSKIKIITETRRRPDGIEYTTKNVLKTSKIFDYDHPEDIAYSENDELISSEEATETDENGSTIRTVTETRRKKDGTEYTTKKVYKTSKIDETITPSDDDEVIDKEESEEKQSDGTILKIIIEKRRTKDGQEYTHRQVYRTRKLTLSGIDVMKGTPSMDNDDEVIDRKEKEELDENNATVKVVTETRKRKDGSTYSFEYVLRSFKTTERDIEKMPMNASNTSNINVSDSDKIIKEEVKEDVQADGTIVRTIIERRRAKDGTEYLRHRIMRIPKLPEPDLVVGSLDDEVIEENVKENVLEDGTQCKAITERRRSSTTGVQYTLRRMSKIYHHQPHVIQGTDEIIDENVTEEEAGNGVMVKTVIRRYQRPDGNVYTTHDIQKSYRSPMSVNVEEYENDELIDRSYDERETDDGYVIKTIVETRCRLDGTHYTIERTEKVSKFGDDVQVSFKGNSIGSGSPGDAVISCEEHEEPAEDGTLIKTIIEVRRRQDGTEYTNKITIRSTQVLVPEHETSYVIIKAESKDDDESKSLFPSLDDEIVYTREKKETDEKGNPITIIIETRQSKKTGEKYNLTKKVHTTDVVMTDQGEKVLSRRTQPIDKSSRKPKVSDKRDDDLKTKSSTPSKRDSIRPQYNSSHTSPSSRRPTSEDTTRTVSSKTTSIRRNLITADKKGTDKPQSSYDSEPSPMNKATKQPIKRSPSGDSKPVSKYTRKPTTPEPRNQDTKKIKESPLSSLKKEKPSPSTPSTRLGEPKTKVTRKPVDTKKPRSSPDSSPELISENDSSGRETPSRITKTKSETPKREPEMKPKRPLERVPSSPRRGRSPLRSGTSTPREGTPVRQCCKRSPEQESPVPKQKLPSTYNRKKPTEDQPKSNGDVRKYPSRFQKETPKKIEHEKLSRFERPSYSKDSPRKTPQSKVSEKPLSNRGFDSKSPKKLTDKPRESKKEHPQDLSFEPKEPIVSLPQTPLTEEMKAYPATSSPFIEDVSLEPDLPYHTVHRPSLVREPSEYNQPESYDDVPEYEDTSKVPTSVDPDATPKKPYEQKPADKKTSDSFVSSSSEDESKKYSTEPKEFSPKSHSSPDRKSVFKPSDKKPETEVPKDDKTETLPKRKVEVPKSLLSQIVPDEETRDSGSRKPREEDVYPETKKSFSARLSMFEKSSSTEPKTKKPFEKSPEKKLIPKTENLVPVKEPSCVRKYIHPLGSDSDGEETEGKPKEPISEDERDNKPTARKDSKSKISEKLITENVNLSSTRLVMSAIGSDSQPRDRSPTGKETKPRDRSPTEKDTKPRDRSPTEKDTKPRDRSPTEKDTKPRDRSPTEKGTKPWERKPLKKPETTEDDTIPSELRERSPFSKESSPYPRSKEGSPAPFTKEDSPGRFITGKPIDQGPNTSKIKRLERSNSNKKIIYEDLEISSANLPTYLKDIEFITDITVLETLLQKAESYEERRVIRGHIRSLKKTDTGSKHSSPAPYKRFVDSTTPSRPSPTASPILSRRVTSTSADNRFKSESKTSTFTTPKGEPTSPVAENKGSRKSPLREVRSTRKTSNDESSSSRKSSLDEPESKARDFDTGRRRLKETVTESRETSYTTSNRPKYREVSPDDSSSHRRTSPSNEYRRKNQSPTNKGYRQDSPESSDRDRRSSPDDISRGYRKPSTDELIKSRKKSSDSSTTTKKVSREEVQIYRKSSSEETEVVRKSSLEHTTTGRKYSSEDRRKDRTPIEDSQKYRKSSTDSSVKGRKTSSDESKTPRKISSEEIKISRKSSRDEVTSTRKTSSDYSTTSRSTFERKKSREDTKDHSPEEKTRKPSFDRKTPREEPKPTRKVSEETKSSRTPSSSKSPRKISSEEPKPTRKPYSQETSKRVEPSKEPKDEPKKFTRRYPFDDAEPADRKDKVDTKSSYRSNSSTLTRQTEKTTSSTPLTSNTKENVESQLYMEPLRHQKAGAKKTPTSTARVQQTNVDKIVSPYGVGPTDENGVPLIGLKALRRKNQQQQQPAPVPTEEKKEEEEFVPSDAQGRPLFGIRAVKKAPLETATFTTTQVAKESTTVTETLRSASVSTEGDHFLTSVATQPRTHTTTVVSSTNRPVSESHEESGQTDPSPSSSSTSSSSSSDDDSQRATMSHQKLSERKQQHRRRTRRKETHASTGMSPASSEDEEGDNEVKSRRPRLSRREPSSGRTSEVESVRSGPPAGETSPSLVRSIDISLRQQSPALDTENENEKPVSLRDIIKLHEAKVVTETSEATETPTRVKPRKILRDTFETTTEQSESRPHRTWDLQADLSTRSQPVTNIIAKHETLTQQDSFKSEKKLNGILKKSSITSTHSTRIASSESERDESPERSQIMRRGSPERPEGVSPEDYDDSEDAEAKKSERKTSYTEITLSQPTSKTEIQVGKSSSATVDLDSSTHEQGSSSPSGERGVVEEQSLTSSGVRKSFLDDRSKVTGISDVLTRMEASPAVDHEAKVTSDEQARSLLNKFLGAQVLMSGVESMMANASSSVTSSHSSMTRDNDGKTTVTRNASGQQVARSLKDGNVTENRKAFSTGPQTVTYSSSSASPKVEGADIVKGVNINEVTDDFALNQLLDSCEEYDERRRVRMRLKALMAEKKALQKQLSGHEKSETYSSSSRRIAGVSGSKGSDLSTSEGNSSYSFSRGSTQVTAQKSSYSSSSSYSNQNSTKSFQSFKDGKSVTAFDKFKRLDSPSSNQSAKGPSLPGPLFQLSTSLNRSASGVKDMILTWCQCRTRDYKGVKIENFSTSWNDGMAFCALIHHFYPDAFDFNTLDPRNRRQNFALAFRVADEKAGVMPLLDVDDMVLMKKPDWKCVFTYVQSLYKRLKDE